MAQYLVLKYSHTLPKLTHWSDNVRIFESFAQQDVMDNGTANELIEAYCTLRNEIHHRNLLGFDADVEDDKFSDERNAVIKAWEHWLK